MTSPSASSLQMTLPIGLGDKASFDNFWVGHNTELIKALRASIEVGTPKLIYFYGPSGAGKSHLLFAAAQLARAEVIRSSYLSMANPALQNAQDLPLTDMVDVAHLVCIDDLGASAGHLSQERSLFALFEQIKHAGGLLLVAADQPPEQAGLSLPDLVSRLSSGLIYPLQALTDEQKFAAIKLRATQRGLKIGDEVVRYLLRHSSRDTRQLFEMLDTLDRASLAEKRKITIPFLQSIIR
jgi:DnaA family protein